MRLLRSTLKIGAAGATIFGIGWAILTFGGNAEVKRADADIISFDFAPKTNTQKFQDSLDELGMEKARYYDWNGNKMAFSTMVTDDEPLVVLHELQEKFREKGLNDRIYSGKSNAVDLRGRDVSELTPKEREAQMKHLEELYVKHSNFFAGGMVPNVVTRDYVTMHGMDSKGGAATGLDFIKEVRERGSSRLTDSVGAARTIEIFRESGRTRVAATWTDDDVDFSKFRNASNAAEVGGSSKVPACMGCERLMRFKGETEKGYAANLFHSDSQTKADVVRFYKESMARRGWMLTPATKAMMAAEQVELKQKSDVEFLSFARGNEFVNVLVYTGSDGKTVAKVMEAP